MDTNEALSQAGVLFGLPTRVIDRSPLLLDKRATGWRKDAADAEERERIG